MTNQGYWGEIPEVADTESGIAALEKEQITKPRPMDVEGSLLHQPSSRHHPPTNEALPSEHFQMDPLVMHSIRLIQHIKKVRGAISDLQQDLKSDSGAGRAVGPVPEYDGPQISQSSHSDVSAEENFNRDFVRGEGKAPPPMDDITCRKLIRRSIAALCAHLSFDSTQESVLETLTDVCHEFLCQFTRHLGSAADRRAINGNLGFPDILERVFHDMGLGSVTDLHDFYQERVIAYHQRLQQQCAQVMKEYNSLVKQPVQPPRQGASSPSEGNTLHVIRIKEEPNADIQFPLLDENDAVNEAEQLLNIESLGSFEITVEHETTSGLTTEVDSKWSHRVSVEGRSGSGPKQAAEEASETVLPSEVTVVRTPQSNIPRTPQSNIPQTPQSNIPRTPQSTIPLTPQSVVGATAVVESTGQEDTCIGEPGSLSSMDIFSPSVPTPSKAKKKKKN